MTPAAESRFAQFANLPPSALRASLAIEAVWLAEGASEDALAPSLYRALQRGRIRDLNTVVAHLPSAESPLGRLLRLAELNGSPEPRNGVAFVASAQMLDVAIYEASRQCSEAAWEHVRAGLPLEAIETVRQWLPRLYEGSFIRSVLQKTLTRQHYVQALSNAHHYVRQTTQHLAHAVANAQDRDMRRHLIRHLDGEINHEVMLENDLRHLGIDPSYVMRHRMPNWSTKAFMAVQEAAVGYYHDPLMLMACALAGEAVAAHMPRAFGPCLRELVESWGVQRPERAMTFLSSHSDFDGGEAGHWKATANILSNYLRDELTQRRFLCTLRATAESYERMVNSSVDELPLFARVS